MKVKFTPELCSGKDYSGHVILRMPTYAERLSFYSDDIVDETMGEPGAEPETDEAKALARKRLAHRGRKLMQSVGERLGEFIAEVAIKRVSDGYEFKAFDQMNYDSEMVGVLTECSQRLIGKHEVGHPQ
jgi:hypothetical protein